MGLLGDLQKLKPVVRSYLKSTTKSFLVLVSQPWKLHLKVEILSELRAEF